MLGSGLPAVPSLGSRLPAAPPVRSYPPGLRPAPAWRAAGRRSAVKLRVGPALYSVMRPGEQIWAGVLAETEPRWRVRARQVLALAVVAVLGAAVLHRAWPAFAEPTLVGAALGMLGLGSWQRRHVFLAVTDRQVIGIEMKNDGPARVLFAAARDSARVSGSVAGLPGGAAITYRGPSVPANGMWLLASGRWRHDLDEVVASLRAGGSVVQHYRRPMPRPQAITGSASTPGRRTYCTSRYRQDR